jgi:enoyl-[acyl-carrier protein] reductase I
MNETIARSPMRRLATIDDVGVAAVFLSSDVARNMTGGVLHVDASRHVMS